MHILLEEEVQTLYLSMMYLFIINFTFIIYIFIFIKIDQCVNYCFDTYGPDLSIIINYNHIFYKNI